MLGNKKTFINGDTFYKEYTKNEFLYLKMLHGATGLEIGLETVDGNKYITMPVMHMISCDDIPQKKRKNVSHIIVKNIPFILKQIRLLTALKINYSDWLQFGYDGDKMYLIDMDVSYFDDDPHHKDDNFDHLINFLYAFDIDTEFLTESRNMLHLFQSDGCSFFDHEIELYNKLNNPNMIKKYVYYSRNKRHIAIKQENIHIYGKSGNMVITSDILNPEVRDEWELIRIV